MSTALDTPRPTTRRDLALFALIAFGGSWGLAGTAWALGVKLTSLTAIVIGVPYMFFPALGAFVVERRRGARIVESLEIRMRPNLWWLAGWLGPLAISFVTVAVGVALIPGVHFVHDATGILSKAAGHLSPEKLAQAKAKLEAIPFWVFILAQAGQAMVAGPTLNAIAAFGEELGWRGFLQRELAPFGFWRSSWLIGFVWGLWHAPLILQGYNYPAHPVAGVAMMTAMTTLLSPLFAAVRLRGRSVLAAAVAHGTFNATAGFPLVLCAGGSDLTVGVTGLAGLIVLAAACVALRLFVAPSPRPS